MNIYGSFMNIYGSFMNISDEKNKDIYVETLLHAQAKPRKGLFMDIQKIIYEHLWLIDGHF